MVWSQYVYEASAGLDADPDSGGEDDHQNTDHIRLNICDWELQYSDELWDLWDLMRTLVRDAYLEHTLLTKCEYNDFVEFCFTDHNHCEKYSGRVPFENNVAYIWRVMWNELKYLGFAPGATFDDFAYFVIEHTEINNLHV